MIDGLRQLRAILAAEYTATHAELCWAASVIDECRCLGQPPVKVSIPARQLIEAMDIVRSDVLSDDGLFESIIESMYQPLRRILAVHASGHANEEDLIERIWTQGMIAQSGLTSTETGDHAYSYFCQYLPKREWKLTDDLQESKAVLRLKDRNPRAILEFSSRIEPLLGTDFAICVVPSHRSGCCDSGIRTMARYLCTSGRPDATTCLVRHTEIPKLASGGDRSRGMHLASIRVEHPQLIEGRRVLLMDDVVTTGNSLLACKQLLEAAGAQWVYGLCVGETVRVRE